MKGETAYLVSASGEKAKLPKSDQKYVVFNNDDVACVATKGSSKHAKVCSEVIKHGWKKSGENEKSRTESKDKDRKDKKRRSASPSGSAVKAKGSKDRDKGEIPKRRCREKTSNEDAAKTPQRARLKGMGGKGCRRYCIFAVAEG